MTDRQTNMSVLILVKVVTASVHVIEEMLISGVTLYLIFEKNGSLILYYCSINYEHAHNMLSSAHLYAVLHL